MLMNNYPIWWDSTVTVYNKYENPQTNVITWYKKVINGCFWKNDFQKVKLGQVELESDSVVVRIPEQADFKTKPAWDSLPNDLMSNYFTLAVGDIIINGSVSDSVNEYVPGQRSSDLLLKYKSSGAIKIDNVSINTGSGRGLPHYHVQGV